ncbi:MAG: hypothetical protein Q9191_004985 [Dirinaria sp. TL-2023a]
MLILLREFMHQTYVATHGADSEGPQDVDPRPKPCEYFDLIAGTGTGGLIAIMLGRLRMNLVECMEVYVRMTRKVFETDKTIAGIPYRSTLFKASKLEDAIKECVREYEQEKAEASADGARGSPLSPHRPPSVYSTNGSAHRRSLSSGPYSPMRPHASGNPNAYLYDTRENRTKTAVTAVYKKTSQKSPTTSALLRSYRSRKKPGLEYLYPIWQAGRATCATRLAFKPMQIGSSTFLDEGGGNYNPAPLILDEAVVNEWPNRPIGVFLSIGTGKRAPGSGNMQAEWWESFAGGMGEFAEAKRKLIEKIEGCEMTHLDMLDIHLKKRGVDSHNYYRLNVEVGVGEFGMNEWNRLTDISNSTETYLNNPDVDRMIGDAARKMGRIERAKRAEPYLPPGSYESTFDRPIVADIPPVPEDHAVELPSEDVPSLLPRPLSKPGPQYPAQNVSYPYQNQYNDQDKFVIEPDDPPQYYRHSRASEEHYRSSNELTAAERPATIHGAVPSPRGNEGYGRQEAPPRPPKTPILSHNDMDRRHTSPPRSDGYVNLPYPDTDGPPPVVNMARKPEYTAR